MCLKIIHDVLYIHVYLFFAPKSNLNLARQEKGEGRRLNESLHIAHVNVTCRAKMMEAEQQEHEHAQQEQNQEEEEVSLDCLASLQLLLE